MLPSERPPELRFSAALVLVNRRQVQKNRAVDQVALAHVVLDSVENDRPLGIETAPFAESIKSSPRNSPPPDASRQRLSENQSGIADIASYPSSHPFTAAVAIKSRPLAGSASSDEGLRVDQQPQNPGQRALADLAPREVRVSDRPHRPLPPSATQSKAETLLTIDVLPQKSDRAPTARYR